ncbi:tetratricopeptide repeat protein [Frigidibacter sp. ROC022]|uniref:tetratricopeptide repeat protein n=1 Tax=Frigidibacter sp. ROC022 TaxID=2971796 RepID=UPI00215AC714|nr:tetratricopeptide repeat protein [Frigidibacter sp. ROC022]MCR8723593.1 sel1 repeat family protein [Frigidibacter sp. ROC022]
MRILATAGLLALVCASAQAQSTDPAGAEECAPPEAGASAAPGPSECAPMPAAEPEDPAEAARKRYLAGEFEEGFKEAFPLAREGNPVAQNMIGNAYFFGRGVVQDCELGEKWTRRAADQGLDRAMYNFARMKHSGCYGEGVDPELALDYYQRAVAAGFAPAHAWLARLLASGEVGPAEPERIRDLLDRGIAAGMANAAQALADLQASGMGLVRDQAAAVAWYRKTALSEGDHEAMWGLAREYLRGIGDADPDRVAAYALIYELVFDNYVRAMPDYARLLIESPGDYWHDPVTGWAHCVIARDNAGPEFFGEIDAACEALRPMVSTRDLMKAALIAARAR